MVAEWIMALATAGSSSLVAAAATDVWASARAGFSQLLSRAGSRSAAEARLDATAGEIGQCSDAERDGVRQRLLRAWQVRLGDLLEEHPDAVDELRRLISQVQAALPAEGRRWAQAVNTGPVLLASRDGANVANTGVIMGGVRVNSNDR
jgi:hypothetical protein